MTSVTDSTPIEFTPPDSLRLRRDRAERILNGLRAGVLCLLTAAALAYAPSLSPELNRTNVLILLPALAWTLAQYLLWYRRPMLPDWLSVANATIDVTAVTAIIGGYAIADSGALALRSPIFLMYFVVLAARPLASSARRAGFVATLAVVEYLTIVVWLFATHRITPIMNPMEAILQARVSPLDEAAKVLFLVIGGVIATYAASWVEHLVIEASTESAERQRVATRLVQAELDTLKLQLSPHFLFNALNSAVALIGSDQLAAEKMVSELSDFLRLVLSGSMEHEVPLDRELELLDRYLRIQRARFQEKLNVEFDISDEARGALVPSLLLQPLLENAIRHGIGPRAIPGRIWVSAHRAGDMLAIQVVDDGVGASARRSRERSRGTGLGLANTATRLLHLYGEEHQFETGARDGGGFAVKLVIPFHLRSPMPESAEAGLVAAE
ncbi:MAG TPA: histidine kinase [Gemmatimonadaceae bacterium]|jgi:signal transduction histidine kinase